MKLLFKNKQRNYPHFQMPNAALKITPNPLKEILMKIPMISKGGRIIGIKGERILRTNLQLLLRSEKYKDTIAEYLQTDNSTSILLQPWLRKASKFFEDPQLAQDTRQNGSMRFWKKYKAYANTAAKVCARA